MIVRNRIQNSFFVRYYFINPEVNSNYETISIIIPCIVVANIMKYIVTNPVHAVNKTKPMKKILFLPNS